MWNLGMDGGLARRAREGGLDIPEACGLCEGLCPNNVATSLMDTLQAVGWGAKVRSRQSGVYSLIT